MMFLENYKNFTLYKLDKNCAKKYQDKIVSLLRMIPKTSYKSEDILAERKGERVFHSKWEHSLILFDKDIPIGVLIAYEREKENNDLYPENSLYINEIAVSEKYQGYGIGKYLMGYFLKHNQKFFSFQNSDKIIFKIQTEDSIENLKVINFYKSFGFKERGRKKYSEKYDLVMELD